jgi:hypothetical protein
VDLQEIKELLEKSWSEKTTSEPKYWTKENPAWGQCAVTALVVQDFFGGELLRGLFKFKDTKSVEFVGSHYWNRLPDGTEVDLTRCQFPEDVEISIGELRTRQYVLSYPETRRRYKILKTEIERQVSKMRMQ